MEWERIVTAAVVIGITLFAARLIDRRMARRDLAPEAVTRYRVLRRSVTAAIVAIGIPVRPARSIPQVQAVAGAILASGAVIGLVVGFAARRTLGNFIAGLLMRSRSRSGSATSSSSTTRRRRRGDRADLHLHSHRRRRPPRGAERKLASDTIKNASIVSREKLAQVTLNVPLDKDLSAAVDALRPLIEEAPRGAVLVLSAPEKAVVTVRASAENPDEVERLGGDLRLQAHERLRAAGVLG